VLNLKLSALISLTCTGVLLAVIRPVPAAAQADDPAAAAAGARITAICADTFRIAATDLASMDRDIGRALQLSGAMAATPALLRRSSTERTRPVCRALAAGMQWTLEPRPRSTDALSFRLLPVAAEMESNSQYRRHRNNGAFRGGVGASTSLTGGAELSWRGLNVALSPRVIHDANRDFPTIPVDATGSSPFRHPYHVGIDLPQRFGTEGGIRFDPGQSYIRYGTRHFELGVSTENVWLGAMQVQPIMLSAAAPGFPHAFAGIVEPLDVWLGTLGMHAIWGRVTESAYFDQDPDNDHRLFAAAVVEFSPRWIPGLHLGISRVYHEIIPPEGFAAAYWLTSIWDAGITFQGGGNRDEGNAIGALMARWVLPSAGFEAYAEWSREDTPLNMRDLIEEPDWTQAYALGFQQLVSTKHAQLRWYGELIHLGEAAPVRAGKGFFSYYTHSSAIQGHTHDGQLLGAPAGPGSDAQILGVDGFHRWGMSGLWLERTRYDEDTYYRRWARMYGESRHDVETGVGMRHMMQLGPLRASGEVLFNRRANRSFIGMQDQSGPRVVERNLGLRLRAVWRP
jgi:hypothetical protein